MALRHIFCTEMPVRWIQLTSSTAPGKAPQHKLSWVPALPVGATVQRICSATCAGNATETPQQRVPTLQNERGAGRTRASCTTALPREGATAEDVTAALPRWPDALRRAGFHAAERTHLLLTDATRQRRAQRWGVHGRATEQKPSQASTRGL